MIAAGVTGMNQIVWLLGAVIATTTTATQPANVRFVFSRADEPYLTQLRTEFALDDVVKDATSDWAKARALCAWTHRQFRHDGGNQPGRNDPISILHEAAEGKRFRCVEYARVLAGACNAVGLPARVLALKTQDVETRARSAGHVAVEVFLSERQAWAMLDAQWDAAPALDDAPLSAIDFRDAIDRRDEKLAVNAPDASQDSQYRTWVRKYLFYLDVPLDNRYGDGDRDPARLMFVPPGAGEPKVFQRTSPIRNTRYTSSLAEFYAPPARE